MFASAQAPDLPDVENVDVDKKTIAVPGVKTSTNNMKPLEPKKPPDPKLTEEEVSIKVKEIMPRLLRRKEYISVDAESDLTFLRKHSAHSFDNERRVRYFDLVAQLDVSNLFLKIWDTHFAEFFRDKPDKSSPWSSMRNILIVMWNGTDRSKKLCEKVLESKLYTSVISWLSDPLLSPDKTEAVAESYAVKGLFGIAHNTLARCDARHFFREAGIVDAVTPFLKSPNLMVNTASRIFKNSHHCIFFHSAHLTPDESFRSGQKLW